MKNRRNKLYYSGTRRRATGIRKKERGGEIIENF